MPAGLLMAALAVNAGALAFLAIPRSAEACTNFLVTKGASTDGSTMITYAADSHELYGELYFWERGKHTPGARRKVIEWDTSKHLGDIPEAPVTYRVVGNINEHQVAIGETTFGGRKELVNPKGGLDYGSLIYIALQRSKTAREAIQTITSLAEQHGYKSEGESISIADPNEVWLLEMVGKGPGQKGMLWVARRVPDGYVTAHANQPRIRTFPWNDPENCLYAKDVASFARAKGWFSGKDADFSFSDTYAPPDCKDLRARDGRVWSFYRRVAPSQSFGSGWVLCRPGAEPLPLWIKPDRKLGPKDLMAYMRDHFEDTELDMRKGVGAGPYGLPYRWRPMTFKVDGRNYMHERATATQQTGFSFVSQSRQSLPGVVGGLLWFSVDAAATSVYLPMWAGLTAVPKPYAVGTGSFTKFSWDSAFWVFTWVAQFTYLRWKDIIVDVQKVQRELEDGFLAAQPKVEAQAAALYKQSPAQAEAFLTRTSTEASERVLARWRRLGEELLMKYMDGNIRDAKGKITQPPLPEDWARRIVEESGDHFLVEGKPGDPPARTRRAGRISASGGKTPDDRNMAADPEGSPTTDASPTGRRGKRDGSSPVQPLDGCRGCRQGGDGGALAWWLLLALSLLGRLRRRKRRGVS
ncbi:MAG: C69 family dipeptidase [Polyangia bacterium]|jgi:dipeptidase|nr:C69 family dipeptidase [Polyangia bacterium]